MFKILDSVVTLLLNSHVSMLNLSLQSAEGIFSEYYSQLQGRGSRGRICSDSSEGWKCDGRGAKVREGGADCRYWAWAASDELPSLACTKAGSCLGWFSGLVRDKFGCAILRRGKTLCDVFAKVIAFQGLTWVSWQYSCFFFVLQPPVFFRTLLSHRFNWMEFPC